MENFKYCPRCKSKLRNSPDFFECKSCGQIVYKNSAPTASVLIIKGGKVLSSVDKKFAAKLKHHKELSNKGMEI